MYDVNTVLKLASNFTFVIKEHSYWKLVIQIFI